MTEKRVPYVSTDGSSTLLPSNEMEVCVAFAARWPRIFTTNMGGVKRPMTGENITTTLSAYAEDVTRLGIGRRNDSEN